jgi:hypothetical protein
LVVQFIERSVARWKAHGESLRFDAMTLHGLVVLVKEVEVLQRLQNRDSGSTPASGAVRLVSTIAQDQINDTTMINLMDPIMAADPQLGTLGDVAIQGDIKRDLIGVRALRSWRCMRILLTVYAVAAVPDAVLSEPQACLRRSRYAESRLGIVRELRHQRRPLRRARHSGSPVVRASGRHPTGSNAGGK